MAKKMSARKYPKASAGSFAKRVVEMGAIAAKVISPKNVVTRHWVRWKCQFGCGGYGSSLVCPPHSPTPEETRKVLDEFTKAILFESPYGQVKKIAAALEREVFLAGNYKAFGIGSGPCHLCNKCAFDKGCRHPREARPSMEACGIDVYATARRHGFTINVVRTRKDPQHYFGLVLIS